MKSRLARCYRLRVDLAAARDDDLICAHRAGAPRSEIERGVELMGDDDAEGAKAGSRVTTIVSRPGSGRPID